MPDGKEWAVSPGAAKPASRLYNRWRRRIDRGARRRRGSTDKSEELDETT